MKKSSVLKLSLLIIFCFSIYSFKGRGNEFAPAREYYEIRVYHFKDAIQENMLDNYLKNALMPTLHQLGIAKIGVFKSLANDTVADKQLYVLIPLRSQDQLMNIPSQLEKSAPYQSSAKEYLDASYDHAPYTRMEKIFLLAFPLAPELQVPNLSGPRKERVYELRSYESPTEKLHQNKVKMFNEGGEIALFKRLNFNAVFYASVLQGSHMPNLMYMTSFENKAAREDHWKAFTEAPEWKTLSALPEYQHNVSKVDIIFLSSTDYSDI